MTREEAISICRSGKKITHEYFSDDEFVEYSGGQFFTEDGYPMGQLWNEFWTIRTGGCWENGWSIFETKTL